MSRQNRTEEHRAFKRSIVKRALFHVHEIDARTMAFLKTIGIASDATGPEIGRVAQDAIVNVSNPARISSSPGPLLFVKEGDTSRLVIDMIDMLLSENSEMRKAAAKHFQESSALDRVLTPKSKKVLNQSAGKLLSVEPDEWRRAAMGAFDALQDDILCRLAAFRQCLELDFQEGLDPLADSILRPSLTSTDSIDEPMCTVTSLLDKVRTIVDGCLHDAQTLEDVLQRYFRACGHLTLAGDLSLAALVARWMAEHPDEHDAWARIWRWADETESPYARYHACQVFTRHTSLIPKGAWAEFWQEVAWILLINRYEEFHIPHVEAWRIRCALAKHYCQHFECLRPPGGAAETVSAFAWWLADRTASVFGNDEAYLASIRKDVVVHFQNRSELLWQLVHPWAQPCDLRYVTLNLRSLWSTALATQLGPAIESSMLDVPDEVAQFITKALLGCVVAYLPTPEPNTEVFAFQYPLREIVEQWLSKDCVLKVAEHCREEITSAPEALDENSKDPEKSDEAQMRRRPSAAEELRFFADLFQETGKNANLPHIVSRLAGANEADAVLITGMLRAAAYMGTIDPEVMWKALASEEWRTKVLVELNETALDHIVDTFAELQYRADGERRSELPHYFAELVEEGIDNRDRRELVFAFTVLTSIYTDTCSALQRLFVNTQRRDIQECTENWRERLKCFGKDSPPWIAGKIRAVLSIFP